MPGAAVAAATPTPAAGTHNPAAPARVAATRRQRLDTNRLVTVRREHPAQALFQLDLGLPAEDLPCARDIRLAYLGVVHRQRLVHDLARRSRQLDDRLRELEDRELARVAEIDGQVLPALGEQHEPADEVVHVTEA